MADPRTLAEWSETNRKYGFSILYRLQDQAGERWIESAEPGYEPPFWEKEPSLSRPELIEAAVEKHLPFGHPDRQVVQGELFGEGAA
jgi:hypothetical protein